MLVSTPDPDFVIETWLAVEDRNREGWIVTDAIIGGCTFPFRCPPIPYQKPATALVRLLSEIKENEFFGRFPSEKAENLPDMMKHRRVPGDPLLGGLDGLRIDRVVVELKLMIRDGGVVGWQVQRVLVRDRPIQLSPEVWEMVRRCSQGMQIALCVAGGGGPD